MDPYYYHAHMTLAELMYAGGHHVEAARHYEKALILHPTLIAAIDGYTGAVEAARSSSQQLPPDCIAAHYDLEPIRTALAETRNSDLPETSERSMELFVHGFLPVNHGEQQPRKLALLRARRSSEALRYLTQMLNL